MAARRVIALAGNPNVGKSTLFNRLTGMNQHTGNWPGKTVAVASGRCESGGFELVDLPGVYSLAAHSPEEEVARDFLRSKRPDGVIVVCDATCLQRGVALALQTLEITPRVVIAVNLLDEAAKKGLRLDLKTLKERLGVPVVGVTARRGDGLDDLLKAVNGETAVDPALPRYPPGLEQAIAAIMARAGVDRREALRALDDRSPGVESLLAENGLSAARLEEERAAGPVREAQRLCEGIVAGHPPDRDRKIDRFLTGRLTGVPVMLALLLAVFWITIVGANVPSSWLAAGLFWLEDRLADGLTAVGAADWLTDAVAHGMFRTLAWVVSVMLPPMAIFFPLFTLLEDVGYLPRIAFNLDKHFHRACACGKQALTMCMGFGCNAAGVVGCR
ncbi:MAG: FeoB small GTPase domain-containing protein, partial [Acutalibacteraceae bacterium]